MRTAATADSPARSPARPISILSSSAVENALLYENLRFYLGQITRAQEDERQRIAREPHDETAQGLIELSRRVDALALDPEELGELTSERLERLQEHLEDLLQGVRRLSRRVKRRALLDPTRP